ACRYRSASKADFAADLVWLCQRQLSGRCPVCAYPALPGSDWILSSPKSWFRAQSTVRRRHHWQFGLADFLCGPESSDLWVRFAKMQAQLAQPAWLQRTSSERNAYFLLDRMFCRLA